LEREQLPTALGEEMGVLDEVGGVDALNPYWYRSQASVLNRRQSSTNDT
jgi:hypothetical protein